MILNLTSEQVETLAAIMGDAYAYRFGEAYNLDDPDLDEYDREQCVRYLAFAAALGLEIPA